MTLTPAQIEKFKWAYPAQIRTDPDAPDVARVLDFSHESAEFILQYPNSYVLFQACGCASLILNGLNETYFRLVAAYYAFRDAGHAHVLEGILSAILLITSRSREFGRQAEFLELYLGNDPQSPYANNARLTNMMLAGDVELAESLVRQELRPDGLLYYQSLPYWCGLLLMHDELPQHLPWLETRALLDQSPPDFVRRAAFIRELAAALPVLPAPEPIEAFCISLPSDTGRWQRARKVFAKSAIKLVRIDGVAGRLVPDAVRHRAAGRPIEGGEYGCFASHLAAWEQVVACGQPRLIVEDDAFPLFRFSLAALTRALPADADVVFLNQRFNEFANHPEGSAVTDYLQFRATGSITPATCSNSPVTGGEGYILTPAGARRLIEMYTVCCMPVPVDWFIFFATRPDNFELEHFAPWQMERMAQATGKAGCLRGYYSVFPAIICDDMDYSPRRSNS